MQRLLSAMLAAGLAFGAGSVLRAGEQEARVVLDKAIKALGGEAKLARAEAFTGKGKGTITFNGNENQFANSMTVHGLDRFRSEFEGEFNGNKVQGVTVLNGDKAWRKFGDNKNEMDAAGVANEKRTVYLQVAPVILVTLKGKGFKLDSTGDEKVGDKPAAVLKVTGPDGKDFTISFDKDSGLPVKMVAKVVGFQGQEFMQETTYADFKDFDGIKRATKIEVKRDGETFLKQEVTEFKVLDKVDPAKFEEPQ